MIDCLDIIKLFAKLKFILSIPVFQVVLRSIRISLVMH